MFRFYLQLPHILVLLSHPKSIRSLLHVPSISKIMILCETLICIISYTPCRLVSREHFLCWSQQVFGECCSCLFVFTNGGSHCTTITHLLISWSPPTAQFYSAHSSSHNTASTHPFPFTAPDSETSSESLGGDEEHGVNLSVDLDKDSGNGRDSLRRSSEKIPFSDATNSRTRIQIRKGNEKRLNPPQFDAFTKPEEQPFQTSWSTVFYSSPNPVEGDVSSSTSMPPLRRRGCYVCRLSPTCSVAALAINMREASESSVVFFSPLVDAGLSSPLYSSKMNKSGRYVGEMYMYTCKNVICSEKRDHSR